MFSAKCCYIAVGSKGLPGAPKTNNDNKTTVPQVVPVKSGGTVYYLNPSSGPIFGGAMLINVSSTAPMSVRGPVVSIATPRAESTAFTVQELAQLLVSSTKDHLPEWKLAQYNGDPVQWHHWFGEFKSAIDSVSLTDDVKLTYLKILKTDKAETAIAEFAYCGTLYKDALKTLERKFGQPQAVVKTYLDKLGNFPPLKMQNSKITTSCSATISALVGAFGHCTTIKISRLHHS